ncbi:MAG: hypothetical protein ACFFD4_19275 [Candidatus Odinarchaeota archaeon]
MGIEEVKNEVKRNFGVPVQEKKVLQGLLPGCAGVPLFKELRRYYRLTPLPTWNGKQAEDSFKEVIH